MSRQNKKVYSELINRIALVLLINQALLLLLSNVVAILEAVGKASFGDTPTIDFIFRMCECLVYFISFVAPVNVFNKMNKNAEKEVYLPCESPKCTTKQAIFMLGVGLGATSVAVYVNYCLVDAFWNYSEFSQEYLWKAELEHPYQVLIYFIYCAVIPAIVEELLFRGTICKSLGAYGKKTAVVLSAVLFALMHSNVEQLLYSFVAGLFLAWIYVETKSIIYPMMLHFINNGISVAEDIVFAKASAEIYNAYSSFSVIIIYGFVAISVFGFLSAWRKEGSIFDATLMKPDENGEEALPLTKNEKIDGFFTKRMVIFILYSLITMIYYIYLSTQLI